MTKRTTSARIASAFTIVALMIGVLSPIVASAHGVGASLNFVGVPASSTSVLLSWTSTSASSPSLDQHNLDIWFCSGASCTPSPSSTLIFSQSSNFLSIYSGSFTHTSLTSGTYKYFIREKHGGDISATLINQITVVIPPSTKGGLLVKKVLVQDNGGTAATTSFSFSIPGVNSGNPISFEADAQNDFTLAAGSYTVTEAAASGYAASYSGCSASVTTGATTTCTITNNDIAPSLTLNKVVTNNYGGTATESNWILTATGPTTISGPGAVGTNDVVSGPSFKAGTYTLSESAGPAGYATGAWSCSNGVIVNGSNQITLTLGQTTVCTITNSDIGPKLTVTKVVINDNGGTKTESQFTLLVDLAQVLTGIQKIFSVGSHAVSEQTTAGYVGAITGDCAADGSVSLALGAVKSCTITNNDVAPSLTLVKSVVGGPNFAPDWTLFASGPTSISGTTPVSSDASFVAGSYTLSEVPGGAVNSYYVASPWSCVGGSQASNVVTLTVGQSAVCTITNTYTPPVCDDGVDNDGDGFTDAADVGCVSPTDTSEANESTLALCTDGIDNDSDEAVDLADSDCAAFIPTLTINKVLINDSNVEGATSEVKTAFSFSVGGSPISFDADGSNTVPMPIGIYTVTETAAQGYTTTYSEGCTGELTAGGSAICTITNDDKPTTITIVKELLNNSGKSAEITDFSFTVNDSEPYIFDEDGSITLSVMPGTSYDILETAAPGYATSYQFGDSESCSGIELALGDSVQCTIVNDDIPACSDGIDNDNDSVSDQEDPGCHTDLDANNSESYDGLIQSEGNESTHVLCTDGVDNDGDALIDLADPDCAAFVPPAPPAPPVPPVASGGGGAFGGGITGLGGGVPAGQVLGASCGVYMDKYVRQGKKNNAEQVKKLQSFLNKYMSSNLPITGFFGPLSAAAISAFQTKHADTILAPWGIATPTGIVYRTTLRQINMIECPDIAEGVPELVEWSKANDPKKPE